MKKVLKLIIIGIVSIIIPVNAANYEIKELIPINTKTTIVTDNFSYKNFSYEDEDIIFDNIKNLTDEDRPISISIGLFGKDKRNIGTINYCSKGEETESPQLIKSKEEIPLTIHVDSKYLSESNSVKDIYYISVLNDNIRCRTTGSDEFIGQTVEEIGMAKNNIFDSQTTLLLKIITVLGASIFALFLYKFVFTKEYDNFDGDDVRIGYKKYNKQLKEEREYQARVNPPKPKEVKKTKTDEVIRQEEEAKKEDKSGTDLHNLYK